MVAALMGFMGCGKSSVGRDLAGRLHEYAFVDLDEFIEESEGETIASIFNEQGEARFREVEAEALGFWLSLSSAGGDSSDAGAGQGLLISLGGGTPTNPECRRMLEEAGAVCIYLKASARTLARNLEGGLSERPLLQGSECLKGRIDGLLAERSPIYESLATHIIETDGKTIEQVGEEIMTTLL